MGHYEFRLPDIGEGVVEAEITGWHVKPGDHVKEDQPLLDVMTDKATVDMSSPVEGTVTAIHGDIGSKAAVGSVLVELEVGATAQPVGVPLAEPQQVEPQQVEPQQAEPKPVPAAASQSQINSDPAASPSTRRRAMEWGIDLRDVAGSGPHGRILTEDLERYRTQQAKTPTTAAHHLVEEIPLTGLRRRIAERMAESKRSIPHFTYVEEFDLTELEALRAELNAGAGEDRPKLTLLPFFMRALVKLVPDYPNLNAHFDAETAVLKRFAAIHIGIATQTEQGLMVPVIRHAETRDIWDCARELARVTARARDGSATRDQLTGSTITLTSLGALGGIAATPIINPPEVAILGPNKLIERPVIDGAFLTRRKLMNFSASFDHRIVDGHEAARFVQALKRLIQHPALIFMGTP
ncbi:MAG TPA: dihydrolipoamide acetyltransferase family protein [Rhizomicrobium sp.]|nr:dihydrolipoamide acetyltransferase family protein [Rhizomicrobium sp.]